MNISTVIFWLSQLSAHLKKEEGQAITEYKLALGIIIVILAFIGWLIIE